MEEIIAPTVGYNFDFEGFLEKELGLFLNEKRSGLPHLVAVHHDITAEPVVDICKYFLRGNCRMGTNCNFRHTKDNAVMCKHWLRGLCKKGDHCEFLHEYDLKKMPECCNRTRWTGHF